MSFAKIIFGDSRNMQEIQDNFVDLIITSPPYWNIKDYGEKFQIGYGQSLHEYLKDLYLVWKECLRVLKPGGRICINIGDQFLRTREFGKHKIVPIHAEIIVQCENLGLDYMGSIIWQKRTTKNTTGGASIMGSYPYPPNGMIEIDYEYILIFKKEGEKKADQETKELSRLSKEEWIQFFQGHWNIRGERQKEHQAMFPEEIPFRLIKMFSFVNDWVLDPFLGSGTTIKVALDLNRNAIGYEINKGFKEIIESKLNLRTASFLFHEIEIIERNNIKVSTSHYQPMIKNIKEKKRREY